MLHDFPRDGKIIAEAHRQILVARRFYRDDGRIYAQYFQWRIDEARASISRLEAFMLVALFIDNQAGLRYYFRA